MISHKHTIEKVIRIDCLPSRLFEILTDPDEIVRYFPVRQVVSERKVGGRFELHGEADGAPFTDFGSIDEFLAPSLFQYSYWSTNHGTERLPENHMTIRYELSGTQSTELKVIHSNVPDGPYYENMIVSWDYLLGALKQYAE